jgi:CRISPR-associated protein Csm5
MPEYTLFDVQVTMLTPVHIGSGRDLLLDYDYALRDGRTWRIDEDALLDAQDVDDPSIAETLARTPLAQLLREGDFREGSRFFHYVLTGMPRSRRVGAQLREQVKDVWHRPYLPGSSVKGALRTALAWHGFGALKMRPDAGKLGRRRTWAAQEIEREILGRDPNHDLLRALHVGDSAPLGADSLMLVNAQVLTRGGTSTPIEVEAVRPETAFRLACKLDEALFSDWAGKLRLGGREAWLRQLPAIVRAHIGERIRAERAWYAEASDAGAAQGFYDHLARLDLPENAFVVQLGWGGGWGSKTLGSHLLADGRFMEGIIERYRLARGRRQRGDPFPKSRRIAVQVAQGRDGRAAERPSVPLGWALVEMFERDREGREPAVEPDERITLVTTAEPAAPEAPEEEMRQAPEPPTEEVVSRPVPGPGTGTVTWYNMAQGRGTVRIEDGELEVEVQAEQLRDGVPYLATGARVSFTVVRDDSDVRLADVGPAAD